MSTKTSVTSPENGAREVIVMAYPGGMVRGETVPPSVVVYVVDNDDVDAIRSAALGRAEVAQIVDLLSTWLDETKP